MVTEIHVTQIDATAYRVSLVDDPGRTEHVVTVAAEDLRRLGGTASAEALIEEPKESILERFDLTVIGRYFPEYEREIRRRLA